MRFRIVGKWLSKDNIDLDDTIIIISDILSRELAYILLEKAVRSGKFFDLLIEEVK